MIWEIVYEASFLFRCTFSCPKTRFCPWSNDPFPVSQYNSHLPLSSDGSSRCSGHRVGARKYALEIWASYLQVLCLKYLKFHFVSDPKFRLLRTLRSVQNWLLSQLAVTVTPEPLVGWWHIYAFWKGIKILYQFYIGHFPWFCTVSNQRCFVRSSSA
jgi:hypothetical protein